MKGWFRRQYAIENLISRFGFVAFFPDTDPIIFPWEITQFNDYYLNTGAAWRKKKDHLQKDCYMNYWNEQFENGNKVICWS